MSACGGCRRTHSASGGRNAVDIVAIELLCACQALKFHRPLRAAVGSEATLERVRQAVPFRDKDTLLYPDIHALRALINQGELSAMLLACAKRSSNSTPRKESAALIKG